jgi:hypothetical protein
MSNSGAKRLILNLCTQNTFVDEWEEGEEVEEEEKKTKKKMMMMTTMTDI